MESDSSAAASYFPSLMKVCPQCSFANDERFPTCAYCSASIADVASIETVDPSASEVDWKGVCEMRRKLHGKQIRWAAVLYAAVITLTALCPGFVFKPFVLLLYALSSLTVVVLIRRGVVEQLSASLLQGVLSLALLFVFGTSAGPFHPFLPFMLLSHIVLPTLFWHWTAMIDDAHR